MSNEMCVEKFVNDAKTRTFEFQFRINRVWMNSRLFLFFIIILRGHGKQLKIRMTTN